MSKLYNQPSVAVLIVSYNFEPWIDKCLISLQNSSLPTSILVVDNGSNDSTVKILREKYNKVEVIENKNNLGFGKANNIGIDWLIERGFKYIFLLNQDAWIEPDTIEKLIEVAEKNRDYAVLSPVHLNESGNETDFGFSHYTGLKNRAESLQLTSPVSTYPFINAAMWLVPTSIWEKIGGFSPLFSHYGEDLNWVQRAQKEGFKVGLVRDAFGYHGREAVLASTEKHFYSEYVFFLTEAVNPLYSYPKSIIYSLLAPLKKAIKSILKGKIKESGEYIKIALRLIKLQPAIRKTRRNTV